MFNPTGYILAKTIFFPVFIASIKLFTLTNQLYYEKWISPKFPTFFTKKYFKMNLCLFFLCWFSKTWTSQTWHNKITDCWDPKFQNLVCNDKLLFQWAHRRLRNISSTGWYFYLEFHFTCFVFILGQIFLPNSYRFHKQELSYGKWIFLFYFISF